MPTASFAPHRLRKRHDFLRIQRLGLRFKGSYVLLIARKAKYGSAGRFGLNVPKTIGKAHIRNLVKRRLRHLFRDHSSLLLSHDWVIFAQPAIVSASFEDLKADLLRTAELLLHKIASASKRKPKS